MDKHIINTISKYKIIGLGENSHLTDFPIVYRLKLFKELAINYNYNVICLENDIFYTSIINAYIHSKIKTDPQLLVENLFGMWTHPYFVNFIIWARGYNRTVSKHKRIHFIGFDSQNPFIFRKQSKELFKKIYYDCYSYYNSIFPNKKSHIKELFSLYNSGYEKLHNNTQLYDKYRENISYKIFMKQYNYILPKKSKFVILAHQAHLSKYRSPSFPNKPFGSYIYDHFGKKFYSIGMNILSGKLACKNNFNGVPIKSSSYIKLKSDVSLVKKHYNTSIECDESKSQYKINPMKYHDAILLFKYDTPFSRNLKTHEQTILDKINRFFSGRRFDIIKFYKHFKVDLPNKYILHYSRI